MANKMVWLLVQIALCILLLWLMKELSDEFSIFSLVAAYLVSLVVTKGLEYWMNRRKATDME